MYLNGHSTYVRGIIETSQTCNTIILQQKCLKIYIVKLFQIV